MIMPSTEDSELNSSLSFTDTGCINLYRSDPLARFLIDKCGVTPTGLGLLSIAISSIVSVIYLLFTWKRHTPDMVANSLPLLVAALMVNPIVYGYYLWSFQKVIRITQDLISNNILIPDIPFSSMGFAGLYGRRWHWLVALAMAIVFGLAMFGQYRFSLTNKTIPLLSPWLIAAATSAVVYSGTILVINLVCNVLLINCILEKASLNINPLHPDRCGGLKPLSTYSLQTAYLVGILGIWVGILEYTFIHQRYILWFHALVPFYMISSMLIFFGPLLAAHKEMDDAKKGLLHRISRQYKIEYEQICLQIDARSDQLNTGSQKLVELKNLYDTTDRFPVWPFDVSILRQYILTISTPLVSLGLIVAKEMLINALKAK
jgi:hypothetical protein